MRRTLTFVFVVSTFVIFRSPTLAAAGEMLASMLGAHGVESLAMVQSTVSMSFAVTLVAILAFVNLAPNTWQVEIVPRVRYGLALGTLTAIAIMSIDQVHPFIYFQF